MRSDTLSLSALVMALATALNVHAADEQPSPSVAQRSEASAWRAFDGLHVRLEADGHVSCYSTDGENCSGGLPDQQLARPLKCGAEHQSIWRKTGYDEPGHWCNRAFARLFASWKNYEALGFRNLLALHPEGHMMCVTAADGGCRDDTRQAPSPDESIVPLICGPVHQARHNTTGYEVDTPNHWCKAPLIVAELDSIGYGSGTMPLWSRFKVFKTAIFNIPAGLLAARLEPILAFVGHRAEAMHRLDITGPVDAPRTWLLNTNHIVGDDRPWDFELVENTNTVFSFSDGVIGVDKGVSVLPMDGPGPLSADPHNVDVTFLYENSFQEKDAPWVTRLVIAHPRRLTAD